MEKQSINKRPCKEDVVKALLKEPVTYSSDEVVKVIYSKENDKRFIIYKTPKGFYKVEFQAVTLLDDDEWNYICNVENAIGGYWSPIFYHSVYGTVEDAVKELEATPEYKQYF
jgi:hypothetical protein